MSLLSEKHMNLKSLIGIVVLSIFTYLIWPSSAPKNITTLAESPPTKKDTFEKAPSRLPSRKVTITGKHKEKIKSTTASIVLTRENQQRVFAKNKSDNILATQGPGKSTPLKLNSEAAKKSAEALLRRSHPERLSVMSKSKPYDHEGFLTDSSLYLSEAIPSRAFETSPSSDSPQLKALSPYMTEAIQGDFVTLIIQATPNSAVSFFSPDLGSFSNGLTSMSVQANSSGVASLDFKLSAGTYGRCNIVCASPLSKGLGKFVIYSKIKSSSN
jgi:hypothetical protein